MKIRIEFTKETNSEDFFDNDITFEKFKKYLIENIQKI